MALLFVFGAGVAYHNTLSVPFVFDDYAAIESNPTLRSLWPLSGPLSPPTGGLPVSGRPLPNLAFALNRAISGDAVWSYHLLNLALHVGAGLVLFAVLRRTLARPIVPQSLRRDADLVALAVSAIWLVHPLQTAAVTYLSQRTELLVALCYLLTLYGLARAAEAARGARGWGGFAVLVCAAGMACKEVMVSAPLVALLYDRTFFSGGFVAAWRRRWWLHAGLVTSWGLLGWLVLGTAGRGGTAGFGLEVTPLQYAVTQAEALLRYLGLVVWPHPLVFDHGRYLASWSVPVVVGGALVAGLLVLTAVAWRRWPAAGFAGTVFFAVLAPTSSFVPVATQTIGEHRMYLPLGVVLTFGVAALWSRVGRRALPAAGLAVVAAAALTIGRNGDYATAESLWRDTVRKRPGNARAHNNLATILLARGATAEGVAALETAVRLDPFYTDALRNLARAELEAGRAERAVVLAEEAQRLDPGLAAGWGLVGAARSAAGQREAAAQAWREAVRARPDWAEAHASLGHEMLQAGAFAGAVAAYEEARRLKPRWPDIWLALAEAWAGLGRRDEALRAAQEAVRLAPDSATAAFTVANLLFELERSAEAVDAYRTVLRLQPEYPLVRFNYGNALLETGRPAEALEQFTEARRGDGPSAPLACARALALLELGRSAEAAAALDEALQLDPDSAPAQALRRTLAPSR